MTLTLYSSEIKVLSQLLELSCKLTGRQGSNSLLTQYLALNT